MPTNPNMVAIQTVTVGAGGASSIEFTSIPQTYTDLVVQVSARATSTGGEISATLQFNNNSTNYSSRWLRGNGATASSGSDTYGTDEIYLFEIPGASTTASTFQNGSIYIPNYTSSNNKSVSVDSVSENNATTAWAYLTAGLWSNSAAITSIKLLLQAGNFAQYSTATLYGVTSAGYGAKATGGIISQDANYYYHTFLASGTFTPTSNITADYLVVAGGGGGGSNSAGGGGAGGLRCTVTATGGGGSLESALSLTASTNYTVTIGAGGNGKTGGAGVGSDGSNSVFSSITATGGGGGGANIAGVANNGRTGGSGGGGGGGNSGTSSGGAGTTNQGYAGGGWTAGAQAGAGGGGAGATGTNASTGNGGNGGNGVATIISGTSITYAGGGGGGAENSKTPGTGGTGGGGNGAKDNPSTTGQPGSAGTANLGGGGGGGSIYDGNGGNGGSGIVIVRYSK